MDHECTTTLAIGTHGRRGVNVQAVSIASFAFLFPSLSGCYTTYFWDLWAKEQNFTGPTGMPALAAHGTPDSVGAERQGRRQIT